MSKRWYLLFLALVLLIPAGAWAAGGHESLGCVGCHGIHTGESGKLIFAVAPNTKFINPRSNAPYTGVSALCLGCHATNGGMGIRPIDGKHNHPISVVPNPKVAGVSGDLLRDGKLECVGCHDPHPSNPYYRYLRVDSKGGTEMQNFCSLCHVSKSGMKAPGGVFSSMDEQNPNTGSAAATSAPAAPAKSKKK